ncbi:hypothetical protein L4D20_20030 [Vibrio kyushuensis]|uniref:hypothetical protein n=1 Tax=Vibrio TaxID=662 RepID=UPI003D14F297
MLMKFKYIIVVALWLIFAAMGMFVQKITYTPTKPHLGIWTGSTVVQYPEREIEIDMQLIVDNASNESARLISSLSSIDDGSDVLKGNITVDVMIIERNDEELIFSLLNPSYSDKAQLEDYIGRDLPAQGTLISGTAWSISNDEMFLYLKLGFGEKLRVVLKRER